jgi:hypothetical protein
VDSDKVVSPPRSSDAVVFWGSVMVFGPMVACVAPLAAGWHLGVFGDVYSVIQPKTSLQLFLAFGAWCFPVAVFAAGHGGWNQARARASIGWPTVAGKVERSEVEYGAGRYGGYFRLAISYLYVVGDREYEGRRVRFGSPRFSRKEFADRFAEKFPKGAEIAVYYDPNDPVTAVLDSSDEMVWDDAWPIVVLTILPFLIALVNHAIEGY